MENNRRNIVLCFNTVTTRIQEKTRAFLQLIYSCPENVRLSPWEFSTLRNFLNTLALDFPQLLDALRKETEISYQCTTRFQRLLNELLDLFMLLLRHYHNHFSIQVSCLGCDYLI